MTESLVHYESRPPAALVSLNRPDKRNALSRDLIAGLIAAFERAGNDSAARCVLLTGSGPAFCAGMDLSELSATIDADKATIWADAANFARLLELLYTLPKPTIAVVNGSAVAGGAGLVSACDLAVAVPTAKFGYPEVRRGLAAAMVMPHLLRHVGERMARWLLLTGESIDAVEALRVGLINEVVPADELLPTAERLSQMLAEGGPEALATTKALLRQFSHQALSVEETAQASATPRVTAECRAGLRAFFEKRPPPWKS
jgi:methylglutaconyl-CoA hydratase